MKHQFKNLDANEGAFFARQLEYVKAKAYDIVYPELKARAVLPVSFEAGPGAETITYEQYSQVGMAKLIANYGDDLPRADIKGTEFTGRVRSEAVSYGWNLQEVRAAAMARKPLQMRKASAAKRAVMALENSIAFFGDSVSGLVGFLNNANLPAVVLPADGTGASTTFASKTPDQVLRDLNSVANNPFIVSKGVEAANTMLLPLAQFSDIFTRRIPDTNVTIGQFFLQNSPHIKSIDWLNELDGAGAGGTDRMVVYNRSPEKVELEVPQDFEQLPVQERNLEFVVPCHARIGGVSLYYPLSTSYADGI